MKNHLNPAEDISVLKVIVDPNRNFKMDMVDLVDMVEDVDMLDRKRTLWTS